MTGESSFSRAPGPHSAFSGEHVGEPRALICLYGPPLLPVDLKFVSLSDAAMGRQETARSGGTGPRKKLRWRT
jgi:hypothetical protein